MFFGHCRLCKWKRDVLFWSWIWLCHQIKESKPILFGQWNVADLCHHVSVQIMHKLYHIYLCNLCTYWMHKICKCYFSKDNITCQIEIRNMMNIWCEKVSVWEKERSAFLSVKFKKQPCISSSLRSVLVWDVTYSLSVVRYWRFRTAYHSWFISN